MDKKPKQQGVEIEVPAAQFTLTGHAPSITVSSSAAALMEVVPSTVQRENVVQADQILFGLDNAVLTALTAEPDGPLAQELDLPDLSPKIIRSLAQSNLVEHQKSHARRSGFVDHFAKGGVSGAFVYLKSLWS